MISRSLFTESKKLRVMDFDDTLVTTKSYVYVTHSNGKVTKLTSSQYAGYKKRPGDTFDYSEFEGVVSPREIKKITNVLRRLVYSIGRDVVYILTARGSYQPIKDYLKTIGINSSKIFVVALSSNNPKDKADWIESKIDGEGYDDIYFADDSIKNVEAVKSMLRDKDVKWRVQHIKK